MLSQTLRPKTLEEVAGQKEAKEIIKAILKNPENSPKCLIFSGGWGQGKTTLSRIVAKELNHIKDENYNILESPFYYELDSTVVGNIEEIRKLRDVFAVSYSDSWRVVTLDECVHYETNIRVMDAQGKEFCCRIGKLVSKKPVGWKALSVNKEGVFSYKPILNFFNNGKKDFYKVDIEVSRKTYNRNCRSYYNKSVVCTNNHRFFDENFKEVMLKDLKVGDVISTYEDYSNNKAIRRSIYYKFYEGNFKFLGKGIIKSIKPYVDTHVSAYDIEVADNHNYVTAGGIVLHNCHAVSSVAQTALLKMLEETQGNTLYILATTDPQKLLPTIRSRALEVHFSPVPVNEIVDNLTHVAEKYDIEISQKVKQIIADRSGGHMRNAHMFLDKYLLLGEEEFIKSVHSALSLYVDYLEAVYNDNKDDILKSLNLLTDIPKDILKEDWNTLVVESMKVSCGFECIHEDIKRLLSVYGKDFGILSQCYMSNWVRDAFIDMPYFQVVFLNLYKVIRGQMQKVSINSNRVGNKEENKFGKPVR